MPSPADCPHRDVIAEADLGEPIPLRITSVEAADMDGLVATVSIGRCPACDYRVASVVLHPCGDTLPMFLTLPTVVEQAPGSHRFRAGGWSM